VDRRADIWAFGVVLYELLTGKQLFQGEDVSHTMAAVIMQEPKLDGVPVQVQRLLKKCLEKDPKLRLRHIGDAWGLLEPAAQSEPSARTATRSTSRFNWIPWAISGLLLAALIGSAAWMFKPVPSPAITRFSIVLPEGQTSIAVRRQLTISPDGTNIAYVNVGKLYVRAMSDLTARAIAGIDSPVGLADPVFSPDGKFIIFSDRTDRTLKKVALSGGAPITICPQEQPPEGTTWGPDGILFAQRSKGVQRVSDQGGTPEDLIPANEGEQIRGAQMLPGGKAVLMTVGPGSTSIVAWDKARLVVQTLKSNVRKTVVEGASEGYYLPTGHLVYAISGVIYAQPFDLGRLETTSGPVSIVEGVARTTTGAAQFTFSASGSLVYIPGPVSGANVGTASLALVNRKGDAELLKVPPGAYDNPRVSRDGKRIAYEVNDGKESSIWVYELSGATAPRRLTNPGTGSNSLPVWADSERVAFESDREGALGIWWQRVDGSTPAERLTTGEKGEQHRPDSWSPDGQTLLFTLIKSNAPSAEWAYSVRDRKSTLFADAPGLFAGSASFSPDGHWVAFNTSDGRVWVQPFPATGARWQAPAVGTDHHAVWSPKDMKELFYIPGNRRLVSVSVNTQPTPSFGKPVDAPKSGFVTHTNATPRNFDVMPDGQHFLGIVNFGEIGSGSTPAQLQVVLNWFEEVKQRASGR
jgi:serine/threonine-protein kinase